MPRRAAKTSRKPRTPRSPRSPAPRGTRSAAPADPPTIAQLRKVRAQMWDEAGGTIEGLIELAKRRTEGLNLKSSTVRKSRRRGAA